MENSLQSSEGAHLFSYAGLVACSHPLALTLAQMPPGGWQLPILYEQSAEPVWQLECRATMAAPADLYFLFDYSAGSPHPKMLACIPVLEG